MGLFDALDALCDDGDSGIISKEIIRAPFGWVGGKSRSVRNIVPHLPYTSRYVEPFGGSFAVGLARNATKMEVLNDKYSGITSFYRVLRDPQKLGALMDRLELTVHSKEEFMYCLSTWKNVDDDVERAARWYYMIQSSFGSLGRHWGRSISPVNRIAGKVQGRLKDFPKIHERMKHVQVENQDWYNCMKDYDSPDTVFYIDPPYMDSSNAYVHELDALEYPKLMNTIFNCKGFVALSGYGQCPLIEERSWDDRIEWEAYASINAIGGGEGNNKGHLAGVETRGKTTEVLWIKEAQ